MATKPANVISLDACYADRLRISVAFNLHKERERSRFMQSRVRDKAILKQQNHCTYSLKFHIADKVEN